MGGVTWGPLRAVPAFFWYLFYFEAARAGLCGSEPIADDPCTLFGGKGSTEGALGMYR